MDGCLCIAHEGHDITAADAGGDSLQPDRPRAALGSARDFINVGHWQVLILSIEDGWAEGPCAQAFRYPSYYAVDSLNLNMSGYGILGKERSGFMAA